MFSLLICALLLSGITLPAAETPSRKILLGGAPITAATHELVLPAKATPSELQAVQEFNTHWQAMTGETLECVAEDHVTRIPIYIGHCAKPAVDWGALGLEGIHLQTQGKSLVLAGGKRGVLYAVYTFLEDYLGCRWFAADCIVIPSTGTVELPQFKKVYVPALEYRDTDYPTRRPPEFGVRNKLNGFNGTGEAKWGGNIDYCGFVHTFNKLVPPAKYGKTHPEYYSEIHGKRVTENSQLCLTNPEVVSVVTEALRKLMRENPNATIFSVSQNDWWNYCTCANCAALAEKEGSQAGPLIHFVNAVAANLQAEFPDRLIDTLAYQWSRKPPKTVRPAPNVTVRLCSIECCFSHPLATCPKNTSFTTDIEGWNKLTNRLSIWDYIINYAHCIQPFPNLEVLKPNIQFFIQHGVTGIYEEANYFTPAGELAELREYLVAKCLWDPDYDVVQGIAEFCNAYYGPAAPAIRSYLDELHRTVAGNPRCHVEIYSPARNYLNDPKLLSDATRQFDEAEKATADAPVFRKRVKTARLGLTYTLLQLQQNLFQRQGAKLSRTAGLTAAQRQDYVDTVRASGLQTFREGGNGDFEATLQAVLHFPASEDCELLPLANGRISLEIVPRLGGRIFSAVVQPGTQPLLKVFGDPEGISAALDGGDEEYAGPRHHDWGWDQPFALQAISPAECTLIAARPDGARLTRRIALLPDRPGIEVASTLRSAAPLAAIPLRAHPVFNVSQTANIELWVKTAAGWKRRADLGALPPDAPAELWFSGAERPAGQWAFLDRGTHTVLLNTFDSVRTETCYCCWNAAESYVNLETFSHPAPVTADAGPSLQNTYELLPAAQAPWLPEKITQPSRFRR